MDIFMDGFACLEALHREFQAAAVPVLLLSSCMEEERKQFDRALPLQAEGALP